MRWELCDTPGCDELVKHGGLCERCQRVQPTPATKPSWLSWVENQSWVRVGDRLPADYIPVLVATKLDGVRLVYAGFLSEGQWRSQDSTRFDGPDGDIVGAVYAWTPLPTAPIWD